MIPKVAGQFPPNYTGNREVDLALFNSDLLERQIDLQRPIDPAHARGGGHGDGKFTWGKALENFVGAAWNVVSWPIQSFKNFLIFAGGAGALLALGIAYPAVGAVVGLGLATLAGVSAGAVFTRGVWNAFTKHGDEREEAFKDLGAGVGTGLSLLLFGRLFRNAAAAARGRAAATATATTTTSGAPGVAGTSTGAAGAGSPGAAGTGAASAGSPGTRWPFLNRLLRPYQFPPGATPPSWVGPAGFHLLGQQVQHHATMANEGAHAELPPYGYPYPLERYIHGDRSLPRGEGGGGGH